MIKIPAINFNANKLNPGVFVSASLVILLLVGITVLFPEYMETLFSEVQQTLINTAGWFYVLSVAGILVAVVYLCASRHGHIKLGPDHAEGLRCKPAMATTSWLFPKKATESALRWKTTASPTAVVKG